MTEPVCRVCAAPGACPVEEGVTYHRQYPVVTGRRLVSAGEAAAQEVFLEEVGAPPASQRWDELVEVVDELRADLDG